MTYFPQNTGGVTSINGQTGDVTGVLEMGPNWGNSDGRMLYWNAAEQMVENDRAATISSTSTLSATNLASANNASFQSTIASLRLGPTLGQTIISRINAQQISTDSAFFVGAFSTATRPAVPSDGYNIFDTTLLIPIWSKAASGTGWINAAGVPV